MARDFEGQKKLGPARLTNPDAGHIDSYLIEAEQDTDGTGRCNVQVQSKRPGVVRC